MTEIYLDVLDTKRKKTFLKLKCLKDKGVLAGGTALSLQIKHRHSFDFDVFFQQPIIEQVFKIISQELDIQERRVDLPNHQTFLTKQGVQVTLFHYEFLPLYPKVKTASLPLFNFKDIAADKAYTIGRRPLWRDYVDLFFLLKGGFVTLKNLIKDAKRKFKFEFAPKLFLEQLIYYKDIRNFKIEFIGEKYSPRQIQEFLKKQFLEYTKDEVISN